MKQYYEALGCQPGDPPDILRTAWRQKCLEHHPDKGGDPEEFIKVTHAYRMISDPSYAAKQTVRPVKDLTFHMHLMVSFIDAFYGTRMVVNYNQLTLNDQFEPMKTEKTIQITTIAFDLPAGSVNGFKHIVKHKGIKYRKETGNTSIQVTSEKHKRYRIENLDVTAEEEVPLETMLKGGEVVVDTLWGHKVLWIPPGTLPNDKLRVLGCGVDQKGHQYCTIKPVYPNQEDLKSKAAWQKLDINWQKAEDQNQQDDDLLKKFQDLKDET